MYRYAEITSLLYPLQELQDRISLEVPVAFIKQERIREAPDQQTAKYNFVYYDTADNKSEGDQMDVQSVVERLAQDVLGEYEISWDIWHDEQSREAHETTVSVQWPGSVEPKVAQVGTRVADAPYDVFPLTVYADQDVFNIATSGDQFVVLKNGEPVVQDTPSPAYALGALVSLLREELQQLETTSGVVPSPPNDFLAAMALSIIDTPDLSDEAKEHFVRFFELTTLQDLGAAAEAQEDSD